MVGHGFFHIEEGRHIQRKIDAVGHKQEKGVFF